MNTSKRLILLKTALTYDTLGRLLKSPYYFKKARNFRDMARKDATVYLKLIRGGKGLEVVK